MCGFIVDINGRCSCSQFIRARDSLTHRGPDGYGYMATDNVRMGHRRLAITGDNSCTQPFMKENVMMVFNGEIYDYQIWRELLERKGYQFKTDGDSEVLATLFIDGLVPETLRGEFSAVFYDKEKKTITAIRDAFGVKPLVWGRRGKEFIFASEAKALFEAGFPAIWSQEGLQQISTAQYTWGGKTLFHNIYELPPGHMMTLNVETGEFSTKRWFVMPHSNEQLSIRNAIEVSVSRRMKSDVNYAMHLSGGIDSAVICALASQEKHIDAFTVAFENEWSEAKKAELIVKSCKNVSHNIIELSHSKMLEALPDALYHGEGIAINGHIGAKWIMNKYIHQSGHKVLLSGEGSDELFLGYPFFREDYFRSVNDVEALEKLKKANHYLKGHMVSSQDMPELFGWLQPKIEFGRQMRTFLNIDTYDLGTLPGFNNKDNISRSVEGWIQTALSGYILKTLADGQEMAHSIEGRPPFLDYDVAKAANSWSYEDRLSGEYDKQMLRDSFVDILPKEITHQKKHPFAAPPLDAKSQNILNDYITDKDFQLYFPGVIKDWSNAPSTVKMALLSLGLLGKAFKISKPIDF